MKPKKWESPPSFIKHNEQKRIADKVNGDLQELFKDKYGLDVNDIYTADENGNMSYFTRQFLNFCFLVSNQVILVSKVSQVTESDTNDTKNIGI